jgi:protoheme IX farnesyltransferase
MSVNVAVELQFTYHYRIDFVYDQSKTAMFGAISIFFYTSVYTPLKTVTSLSVLLVLSGQFLLC